eukprot:285005-Alexandrium_andersonii.AAC.1
MRSWRHYGRVTPQARADTLHRGSLDPLRAAPKQTPYYGRRRDCTAPWGAAKRCPQSLGLTALAHSRAPAWGRLIGGPSEPLWMGSALAREATWP